jgi:micrococcal nuclease
MMVKHSTRAGLAALAALLLCTGGHAVFAADPVLYRVDTAGVTASAKADLKAMLEAEVVRHVDGDTIKVRIKKPPRGVRSLETIRLIGVDTPETVHPKKKVERYGKQASDYTKGRLLGKTVRLAFDWDLRDHYRRLLAYVYLPDGSCHNAELVRQGFGHAYTKYPFQFLEEFRGYEREARENKKGLWR